MGSLGMLFYVVECFTVNLEDFAANAVGSAQFGRINEQIEGDCGFVAVALRETAHEINKIGALDAQRAQVGDRLAQLSSFILNRLLKVRQGAGCLFRGRGSDAAAEDIKLDLNTEKGLEYAVVEVAGDAGTLCLDGAGAQMAQKKDVLKRRPHVLCNAFQPH